MKMLADAGIGSSPGKHLATRNYRSIQRRSVIGTSTATSQRYGRAKSSMRRDSA